MAEQTFLSKIKNAYLLEAFMVAIFCIAPFYYHPNIGGTALNLPANITVWLVVCAFLWLTTAKVIHDRSMVKPPGLLLVVAFPVLATASGFVTGVDQPMEWLFRLLFIWGGVLFLIAVFQYPALSRKRDNVLFVLVISGLLHAVVAALQILQPEGSSLILPKTPDGDWPTGMFLQVNNQASYQAMVLLICLYLAAKPILNDSRLVMLTSVSAFLGAFVLLSSGSRVGILGFMLGLLILVILRHSQIMAKKKTFLIVFFSIAIGTAAATITKGPEHLINKATSQTEYSSGERVVIYSVAYELIKEKPIFGHGIGSFPGIWQYEKAEYFQQNPNTVFYSDYVTHPHNELVFWQVEGGVLASLGILITAFSVLYLLWRAKSLFILALLFPFALHLQVELPFYLSAGHWFAFLLLIALGLSQMQWQRVALNISDYMHVMLKSTNHAVMVVALIFLVHSFIANKQLSAVREGGDLGVAKINPYFNVIAEELNMQQVYFASMDARSEAGLRYFLEYAESAVLSRPVKTTFLFMISSYQTLGLASEACDTAKIANAIYPDDTQFRNYYGSCSFNN